MLPIIRHYVNIVHEHIFNYLNPRNYLSRSEQSVTKTHSESNTLCCCLDVTDHACFRIVKDDIKVILYSVLINKVCYQTLRLSKDKVIAFTFVIK